jgi:hypothetical protein
MDYAFLPCSDDFFKQEFPCSKNFENLEFGHMDEVGFIWKNLSEFARKKKKLYCSEKRHENWLHGRFFKKLRRDYESL